MSENYTPIDRARQLRKNMTDEEKILWQKLRGRRFLGLKFFRQHPLVYEVINKQPKFFIPDFYCAEKQLIIEIDGKIHDFQKEYDEKRAEILKNMGLKIIRFKNEEMKNVYDVLSRIKVFVDNE